MACTYAQLDMVLHLLCMGAPVNQRDDRGMTALHRTAILAHQPGYVEIYELLLVHGLNALWGCVFLFVHRHLYFALVHFALVCSRLFFHSTHTHSSPNTPHKNTHKHT